MKTATQIFALIGLFAAASGIYLSFNQQYQLLGAILSGCGILAILIALWVNRRLVSEIVSRRSTRYGANVSVMVILVLVLLVIITAISNRYNHRFDLTRNKLHTLSDQTRNLLRSLDRDIKAIAFTREDMPEYSDLKDLLRNYADHSTHFSYQFINPDQNPGLTSRYGVTTYGVTVLEAGEKSKKVNRPDEQEFTNALIEITSEGEKTVYFTIGHGEPGLDNMEMTGYATIKAALERDNFTVNTLQLLQTETIPEDASALVVAGPRSEFMELEIETLLQFLNRGGRLFMALDPGQSPRLAEFVKSYGLNVDNNLVIDTLSRMLGGDDLAPIIASYASHTITDNFGLNIFMPTVRTVRRLEDFSSSRVSVLELASTGPNSWGESDVAMIEQGKAILDEGIDLPGPVSVVGLVTINLDSPVADETDAEDESPPAGQARLVVAGDSDFFNNTYQGTVGNADFFLNCINWLSERENLISIRPKQDDIQPLFLSSIAGQILFWIPVVFLPLLIAGFGFATILGRRRNK